MKTIEVRRPSAAEEQLLKQQPTWEHDIETWPAEYDERCETFLVIEGKASITLEDGSVYPFAAGDLVTCKPHTKCVWTVEEPIKKHYIFDMAKKGS